MDRLAGKICFVTGAAQGIGRSMSINVRSMTLTIHGFLPGMLQPMGRLGRAEEIAAVAVLLASDEATFMSGSNIVIDGGMSL